MATDTPSISGEPLSGATMRPRYMGRTVNTYPVSEPEMDNISSLNAQSTIRFSVATWLFGMGSSIWVNAMFYTELTPVGALGSHYIAPFLIVVAVGFALNGCWAQYKRASAWEKIKKDSNPVQAVAAPTQLIVEDRAPPKTKGRT